MHLSLISMMALLLTFAAQSAATHDSAGTTGFNFLKIGMGARPTAMGGAFTAVPADTESAFWNPAGMHGISQRTGVLALNSYLVDTQAGAASIALPAANRTWGLTIQYVTYGDMQRRDASGLDQGTFGAADMAAYLTVAQPVWQDRLIAGVNLKAAHSSIDNYSSDAYMVDLGLLLHGPVDGMVLGAALLNLGGVRSGYAGNHKESLPVSVRLGLSHRPAHMPVPVILLADLIIPNDADAYLAFGAEVSLPGGFHIRPGYSAQQTGSGGDQAVGITGGIGFIASAYGLDYAYASYPDLGDVHRVSISGSF